MREGEREHSDSGHLEKRTKIFRCPISWGASERACVAVSAERASVTVTAVQASEWWEQTNERMSEGPSTNVLISKSSASLWREIE